MKRAKINAVVGAVMYAACLFVYSVALERGLMFWAWVHAVSGAWVAVQVGWFAAVAAMRPRRPRRRTADEWQVLISQLFKQD